MNEEGYRTTTSVVAYTKTGRLLVGQIGKRQNMLNPQNTFYSVKRFIGSKMTDLEEEFTKGQGFHSCTTLRVGYFVRALCWGTSFT